MDKSLRDVLYALPPGIDYTEDLCALDEQDIPVERVPKLLELLEGDDSEAAFRAAWVLCSWGNEEGFEYMRAFVLRDPPVNEGWYPHHLRSYPIPGNEAPPSFLRNLRDQGTVSNAEYGKLRRGR